MATDFFESFPLISYTLDDSDSTQVVADIFRRAILSKEFLDNNSYFETVDVLDGETPEELSFRYYGTQNLHWLILMTNSIIDPRFNWPLSGDDLYKLVVSKYGTEKDVFTVNRAVSKKGYQVETFFVLTEDSTHKKPKRLLLDLPDTEQINIPIAYQEAALGTDFQSNYEVELAKNEMNRRVQLLRVSVVEEVMSKIKQSISA
jgi:hypothetical protein